MKKIGFIDYYLDEWHANNYPEKIEKISGGEFKVCYAYAHIEPPKDMNKMSNTQWSEKYGVQLLDTIEEVVEKSDYLVVLSPDNPEMHEELCKLPLASGKRTYVDKTFAPDKETAARIFAYAKAHNTPCYSCSSLRFSEELEKFDRDKVVHIYEEGPGALSNYTIHHVEPIVYLMNARAKRMMFTGDSWHPSYIIEFEGGKRAHVHHRGEYEGIFRLTTVDADNMATIHEVRSDYFGRFLASMLAFFRTGVAPVAPEQTIDVMAICATVLKSVSMPDQWIDL